MAQEKQKGISAGDYYVDQFDTDGDVSYFRTLQVYRVDSVKTEDGGEEKIFCTKISICFEEIKKTGEKHLMEAKICELDFPMRKNPLKRLHKVTRNEWDTACSGLTSIVVRLGYGGYDGGHMFGWCSECSNRDTDNCKVCSMVDLNKPSLYDRKK